ncbi:MAG: hypothetical protein JKY54_18960 [Flavobacteriales bacterium]|nr:hypothetical protein [Flavobacteriales bacterium]
MSLHSCTVQQLSEIEIISPEKNIYWGNQVLLVANDSIGVDTSYYNDLSLQLFVDPVHFNNNKIPLANLHFYDSLRPSFEWIKQLEYRQLKKLNRKSRRSKCVCYEYRLKLSKESISLYVPEDTACYSPAIKEELYLINDLFIYEKDTCFRVLYTQ